jgi:hypothetical protein
MPRPYTVVDLNVYLADPERRARVAARFWSKVDKSPGLGPKGECWFWRATKYTDGYGSFNVGGRMHAAHRVAFHLTHGSLPPGMEALHDCDVKACVRCLHPGTQGDNIAEAEARGLARHPRGEAHGRHRKPWAWAKSVGEGHPSAKLTVDDVHAIRSAVGITVSALSRKYGIARSGVQRILQRRTWKSVPEEKE